MKHFFLFFFLFFFQSFYGQIDTKDFKRISYDELKKAFFENDGNMILQKKYAKEYIDKAKKENDESKLARGYYFYSLTEKNLNISIKYLDSITNKMKPNKEDTSFPILAYYQKGILYGKLYNYELAIENFLVVEKISQEYNNLEYYYDSKYAIGKLKSENLGEVEDGLKLFKECYNYYKKNDVRNNYFSDAYQRTIFAIADSYKSLNQIDSSSYYNKLGYRESKKTNNNKLHYLFILNEGANQILKKNYKATIDSVDIALPKLKETTNIGNNILASYYYYGKAYEGLEINEKAISNFTIVDSIYQKTKVITPEFTDGYRFLINYYKKTGNKEKQLYYINTLMTIDSLFQKNYRILTRKIQKDYDIPNLMKDKQSIIDELKNGKKFNSYVIITLFSIVLFFIIFGIRQTRLKKTYKERFERLLNATNTEKVVNEIDSDKQNISSNESIGIADEIIEMILKELKNFEKNKGYLNANLNIQNLAQDFNTNSKYLSIVINAKKEKSFVQYINDLRIDNIVNELKNNKNLRRYTISAIAEEAGFNTAESFSKAFFKKTGIKPSYFIKELKEL